MTSNHIPVGSSTPSSIRSRSPRLNISDDDVFSQERQRWITSSPINVGTSSSSSTRLGSPLWDVSDVEVPYTTSDEEYIDGFGKNDDDPDPPSYIMRELGLDFSCYFLIIGISSNILIL